MSVPAIEIPDQPFFTTKEVAAIFNIRQPAHAKELLIERKIEIIIPINDKRKRLVRRADLVRLRDSGVVIASAPHPADARTRKAPSQRRKPQAALA